MKLNYFNSKIFLHTAAPLLPSKKNLTVKNVFQCFIWFEAGSELGKLTYKMNLGNIQGY